MSYPSRGIQGGIADLEEGKWAAFAAHFCDFFSLGIFPAYVLRKEKACDHRYHQNNCLDN